jgi:outer membrane lipoprotein
MKIRQIVPLILIALASGCASGPEFDQQKYSTVITPEQVAGDSGNYIGSKVLWGGMLISITNLETGSQLEVLGYPLQTNQCPDVDQDPLGRFLVIYQEFLEPIDYAPGRVVTVTGKFDQVRKGQVGATEYVYPVVNAESVHLWSKSSGLGKPQIHFGVGLFYGS